MSVEEDTRLEKHILPIVIENYNITNGAQDLIFNCTNKGVILPNMNDYNIIIDKMTIPIDEIPIMINERFIIWVDSLSKTDYPPGFEGGDLKKFEFIVTAYSINDFLKQLGDFFYSILGTYNYATFTFDANRMRFNYTEVFAKKEFIKIYFDVPLQDLFDSLPFQNPITFVPGEGLFYELSGMKGVDFTYLQSENTVELFHTLKKIKIYSDLFMDSTLTCIMNKNELIESPLLTDIDFNSMSMVGNKTIIYHPTAFREYSLSSPASLTNFRLFFAAYYANGEETYIKIKPRRFASISIRFKKKFT